MTKIKDKKRDRYNKMKQSFLVPVTNSLCD